MPDNSKKVVLITGASRGVGLATAKYLSEKGYCVYGSIRKESDRPTSAQGVHFEVFDVTDLLSIQKAVKKIIQKQGRIDVLINNAGYGLVAPLECLSAQEVEGIMNVNFYGVVRMCQEVLPTMRKQKSGHIINISSEQGAYGAPFGSLYSASKAAVESLSEALSIEMIPWDIHVSIIEPGGISTQFTAQFGSKVPEDNPYEKICEICMAFQKKKNKDPESLGPSQQPEEVAQFICGVMEDENPKLRYQTSEAARKMVAVKLKDLSGEAYFTTMKKWREAVLPRNAT